MKQIWIAPYDTLGTMFLNKSGIVPVYNSWVLVKLNPVKVIASMRPKQNIGITFKR